MPRRIRLVGVLAFSGLVAFAPIALAAWPPGGLPVQADLGNRAKGVLLHDGTGRLSVLMLHSLQPGWSANRLEATGDYAPGWSSAALGFPELGNDRWCLASDNAGGIWHTYRFDNYPNHEVRLERREPGASLTALPAIAFGVLKDPAVAPDDSGGAYLSWWIGDLPDRLRLKRVRADGTAAPGWPASGVTVMGPLDFGDYGFADRAMLPDGAGGVYVLSSRSNGVQLHRVTATGAFAGGWSAAGVALEDSAATSLALVRGDGAHMFASWKLNGRVMLTRVGDAGSPAPGWPASGVTLFSAALSPTDVTVVPDGAGGAYATCRTASNDARVVRVLADGSAAPGFPADGLSPLGTDVLATMNFAVVRCAPGHAGGVVVAWSDVSAGDWRVRARWLAGDGTPDPAEPPEPRTIASAAWPFQSTLRDVLSDGDGGVFVLWSDHDDDLNQEQSYVTHAPRAHGLAVAPGAPGLSLAAFPNPARGALAVRFSLPDARPARLELLDLAGRRLAAREVAGAGAHQERLGEPGALAPGVYVVRLSHGGAVRTARVAVTR